MKLVLVTKLTYLTRKTMLLNSYWQGNVLVLFFSIKLSKTRIMKLTNVTMEKTKRLDWNTYSKKTYCKGDVLRLGHLDGVVADLDHKYDVESHEVAGDKATNV